MSILGQVPGYYMPRRLEQLGQSKFDGQQNCQDKLLSWLYNQDKTYVLFKIHYIIFVVGKLVKIKEKFWFIVLA